MLKLTDFSQEHAFEHAKSGCWSQSMFNEWMEAMLEKQYNKGYDIGWDMKPLSYKDAKNDKTNRFF